MWVFLFFKKRSGPELWDSGGYDDPDPDLQADPGIPRVLWPLTNPEEVNRQVDVRRFSQSPVLTCPPRCH